MSNSQTCSTATNDDKVVLISKLGYLSPFE